MREDEETRVVCPLCKGETMIIEERQGSYRGARCWLCIAGTCSRTIVIAWKEAGQPRAKPARWLW